ncbi:uncharacterized protein ssp [Drosophila kikkawai]|uniref:Uncharacterized protein ssp n=1 Tax=Drosophila kikkawai TaxID=30033 RepID=A0A6P4IF23_DROKI|nr:trihelix transcription factor ASIL1 [Drosophila kikkawai]
MSGIEAASRQNTEFDESTNEIVLKILSREYWLLRRQDSSSTVWQVYRQIVRSDGTKLRDYYFCTGCKRLIKSGDISSLRSHICHVKYLQQRASATVPDLEPKEVGMLTGHQIHWSYKATKMLLELWKNNIKHFRSERSSQYRIFRKIAKEMNHLGLKPSDIKTQMDNMSKRYSQEAERVKVTGRPSKWSHFHDLQKLLSALEESNSSPNGRNSFNEENSSPDMETNGIIKQNEEDDSQNDINIEALPSLETYEEELDQQDLSPKYLHGTKPCKVKRFMAIQEERLALEKENLKSFQTVMKEIVSYNKNLCQVLYDNEYNNT